MFSHLDFHKAPFGTQMETISDLAVLAVMLPFLWYMEKYHGANPLNKISENRGMAVKWATAWMGVLLILMFGSFINAHTFIYFQF